MTATATRPAARGYVHEAGLYRSDETLLGIVVPFLEAGLAAREPTIVALGADHVALIADSMTIPVADLLSVPSPADIGNPATAILRYCEALDAQLASGAERIRVVSEIPHPGMGASWQWWGRFEVAINNTFARFPLWDICVYDTRTAPREVLDDVRAAHPYLTNGAATHQRNPDFQHPEEYTARRRPPVAADPLEATAPVVDLLDPSAATARRAVRRLAAAGQIPRHVEVDLVYAVSEGVQNAIRHGRGPVRFRLWDGDGRILACIADRGAGPSDPLVGLIAGTSSGPHSAGLGLWLIHQMCDDVAFDTGPDGFTLRLTMRSAQPDRSARRPD
ncbi:MAG TPA: sensor histidine kinase [Pseudonocardia sp.]